MPSPDEIVNQQNLLAAYRRTLSISIEREAVVGAAHVPPEVIHNTREARKNIERIKYTLRGWAIPVEDYPDDIDPDQPRRARIFISYKRDVTPDQPIALELLEALRKRHDVFIDQAMSVGTSWAERIKAEICRADFLIVFLSEYAVRSEMVSLEIETALHMGQAQGGRPVILPVRLAYRDPFQYPLDRYLNHLNWALWNGPQDTPQLIKDILRAISGGVLAQDSAQTRTDVIQGSHPQLPPPPVAGPLILDLPEGTIDVESHFYVTRSSDVLALDLITRSGGALNIKGPRQMGKSSLLIRVVDAARRSGKYVAFLDFQLFDRLALADGDRFFRQFCSWLTVELGLPDRVAEYWNTSLGNTQCCTRYVSLYLLNEIDGHLVLAMDEVDRVFESDFRSDFFLMLRHWYNSRSSSLIWKRLDLALAISTEPYHLVNNLNASPFNVGHIIGLTDFTFKQIADLNQRHGAPLNDDDLRKLMDLLGGHPYLIRRALYLIASQSLSATELHKDAISNHGPFGDHLRYHLFRLHDKPELAQGMHQVIRTNTCSNEQIFLRLFGGGMVRQAGKKILPRCQLYARYFREHLNV